jgi:hypothetical protein
MPTRNQRVEGLERLEVMTGVDAVRFRAAFQRRQESASSCGALRAKGRPHDGSSIVTCAGRHDLRQGPWKRPSPK